LVMLLSGLRKDHPKKDWKPLKVLVFSSFLLVFVAFLFAIKVPAAHAYYVLLPLVMLYAFYVLYPWAGKRWFRPLAGTLLVCNLVFHLALAVHNREERSFYAYRERIVKALEMRDYRLLGERRAGTRY
jgi:hypothetical protein